MSCCGFCGFAVLQFCDDDDDDDDDGVPICLGSCHCSRALQRVPVSPEQGMRIFASTCAALSWRPINTTRSRTSA